MNNITTIITLHFAKWIWHISVFSVLVYLLFIMLIYSYRVYIALQSENNSVKGQATAE